MLYELVVQYYSGQMVLCRDLHDKIYYEYGSHSFQNEIWNDKAFFRYKGYWKQKTLKLVDYVVCAVWAQ